MDCPRKITGTPGSRIVCELGNDGESWLLQRNWDDGNRTWQEHEWEHVPTIVVKHLQKCAAKHQHVTCVAWHSSDLPSWFIAAESTTGSSEGDRWWGNCSSSLEAVFRTDSAEIKQVCFTHASQFVLHGVNGYAIAGGYVPPGFYKRLSAASSAGSEIYKVCLSKASPKGYWVSDEDGWQCSGFGIDLSLELERPPLPLHVCHAQDGEWVVIRDYDYVCSPGVSAKLQRLLTHFYQRQQSFGATRRAEIAAYWRRQSEIDALKQYSKSLADITESLRVMETVNQQSRLRKAKQKRRQERDARAYLAAARHAADRFGFSEASHNTKSSMISFCFKTADNISYNEVRVNVWYRRRTVGIAVKEHYRRQATQVILRHTPQLQLLAIFDDPCSFVRPEHQRPAHALPDRLAVTARARGRSHDRERRRADRRADRSRLAMTAPPKQKSWDSDTSIASDRKMVVRDLGHSAIF